MSFSLGIVGLPNVGKSTLFQALTKQQVDAANYPFCTIDPNVGVVAVPDERLTALAKISQSAKVLPTTIEFFDIAGLVKGAHQGEGLGNKFLNNIKQVDAICHVFRVFTNGGITHVTGDVNPLSDVETINLELVLADLQVVSKRLTAREKEQKAGLTPTLKQELSIFTKIQQALENGQPASSVELNADEQLIVKELQLLTLKPMLYVANTSEKNLALPTLKPLITVNAKLEAELSEMPEVEVKEYLKSTGETQSGLEKLILASYQLLNLITFFTSGPKETRAWTVKQGARAPEAAGQIHSDFERGFIKAEVINWRDFVNEGGETGAKNKGKMRLEGKDYQMQDGDVVYFHVAK